MEQFCGKISVLFFNAAIHKDYRMSTYDLSHVFQVVSIVKLKKKKN